MIMGGIPFYLDKLKQGKSVSQNIDNVLFRKNAELKKEYQNLFVSLFDHAENYEKIVEILSSNHNGLTRKEILEKAKMKSGNKITTILNNLEYSGFIRSYSQPTKKTEVIYQLIDSFTLFYYYFMHKNNFRDEKFWTAIHLLILTTFGVKQNKYYDIVQNEVTLDDLFAESA
ncbi:hypothetical protein FACS1894177_05160 [Bacteroidia bacterium]|nr:hypothetical protein FACS1894177_05160 [Bacteroidia bacterium]